MAIGARGGPKSAPCKIKVDRGSDPRRTITAYLREKQMSKQQVLAELRRINPGARVAVEVNERALTAAQRPPVLARAAQLKERREEAKQRKTKAYRAVCSLGDFLEACRFVVDVDGHPDAIAKLQPLLEAYEEKEEAVAEHNRTTREHQKAAGLLHGRKYTAGSVDRYIGLAFVVDAQGDTYAEVLEKLRKIPTPSKKRKVK